MKKVYTIIIFEESGRQFHGKDVGYIHRGKTTFDTGLELELLQEYLLIALDAFREKRYAVDRNELKGWLSLLAVEEVDEAEALLEEYPWLEEVYRDLAEYLHRPEEVLGMFSEALRILDRNTVQFMIDEQKKEIEEQRQELKEREQEIEEQEIEEQKQEIDNQRQEIERLRKRLAEKV